MTRLWLLFFFSSLLFSVPPTEPTEEEALAKLKTVLSKKVGPYHERHISRLGDKTFLFEAFIAAEVDPKLQSKILGDFKNYPQWLLRNINQKPGGGTYYVKIQDLKPDPKEANILHGIFQIDVPIFKTMLHGLFKLSSEETNGVFTVRGSMVPDANSVLDSATAVLKSFPTQMPSIYRWIYVHSTVVLRNWLLYEAFPEKLLKRESGERIQIVLDNYQAREDAVGK